MRVGSKTLGLTLGAVLGGLEVEIGGNNEGGAGVGLGGGGESMEAIYAYWRVFEFGNCFFDSVELRDQP